MKPKEKGLYQKYFVLKPRGTDGYAVASRKAMRAYAYHIKSADPDLSLKIGTWVSDELRRVCSTPPEKPLPIPPQPQCKIAVSYSNEGYRCIRFDGTAEAVAGLEVFGRFYRDPGGMDHELWVSSRYDFDEVLQHIRECG